MSSQLLLVQSVLAQTPSDPQASPATEGVASGGKLWMYLALILAIAIAGLAVYGWQEKKKLEKALKVERYKTKELQRRLKLSLNTIRKMETNPDLVHSREFNLDYLRMRMDEEVFHYAIVNQIKIRVKQIISVALRPNTAANTTVGIANSSGRQIDETFDIVYNTQTRAGKRIKAVLFRIEVKLIKLPTQSTSSTINQIIECIETFLNPDEDEDNWQAKIQGRIVTMSWDQKAKPTPLLVLEQSPEGENVTFRSKRMVNKKKR
ncbi:MAG: hypothetical protein WA865_00870 [Spirulinaceae cyanobacterium]